MKLLQLACLVTLFFISCKENKKVTTHDKIESNENEAPLKLNESPQDIFTFNDTLLSKIILVENEFIKINEVDETNPTKEQFIEEVEKSLAVLDSIKTIFTQTSVVGRGGDEFLASVITYTTECENYMHLYIDFSHLFIIPENEWSEIEINQFILAFEPAETKLNMAHNNIKISQDNFANLNNTVIEKDLFPNEQEVILPLN